MLPLDRPRLERAESAVGVLAIEHFLVDGAHGTRLPFGEECRVVIRLSDYFVATAGYVVPRHGIGGDVVRACLRRNRSSLRDERRRWCESKQHEDCRYRGESGEHGTPRRADGDRTAGFRRHRTQEYHLACG